MSYKTGKVYRIVCLCEPDVQYVGSTFNDLRHRWSGHKQGFKSWLKGKTEPLSVFPYFKKYGIDKFKILLIKEYEVYTEHNKDHRHLRIYEQLWMSKLKCVNKRNCFTTEWLKKKLQDDWKKNNKEKIRDVKKAYKKNNKEKIEQQRISYRELLKAKTTCECGSTVSRRCLWKHRKTKKHLRLINM